MAGTGNANKSVNIEIRSDADLRNWSTAVADDLRKLADDLGLIEMELNGRLRAIPSADGKSSAAKARNVVYHIKLARSLVWAARKSILGVYKAFMKQFGAEIEAVKAKSTKKAEALTITK